jgi:microcystin-dependent protein
MADLIVKPSYQLGPQDVLTTDKLNLMATPIVELALADPVNDQNFARNGNFYSSFWVTPTGVSCPVNVWTTNASYWLVRPQGAAVTFLRSSTVPDQFSLFSAEVQGAASVSTVEFGQQINADLSATLRRKCTFSGYLYNATGLTVSPVLHFYTCDAFNNFSAVTLQNTVNLQTVPNATWVLVTATVDLSGMVNVANGLLVAIQLPAGAINDPSKNVLFSRLKIQIGEVATEFVDDTSLFVQTPSIGPTELQDGCIARPALFLPNVIPSSAYQTGSVNSAAIADGSIIATDLDSGTVLTTTSANFTTPAVNANVAITVTDATKILPGLTINIAGAGYYSVVSVAGNVVTAKNLGGFNTVAGTVISSPANVSTQNAVLAGLGFSPVNKAGDTGLGKLESTLDTVVGTTAPANAALVVHGTSTNASNTGYIPAIAFDRPGVKSKAVGLSTTGRIQTVDQGGVVGYLLDTQVGVDTASYQDGSITLAKLATSLINILIAPGTIHIFAGGTPPTGWLICDGHEESRTGTTAALFTAIGTIYGVGNNTTTFNVPDLRGRTPLGYLNTGGSGLTARTFGSKGGFETWPLAIAELPAHNHTIYNDYHSHGTPQAAHTHSYVNPLGSAISAAPGAQTCYQPGGTTNVSSGNAGINPTTDGAVTNALVNNTGGGAGHQNMQPFTVMLYIIKY